MPLRGLLSDRSRASAAALINDDSTLPAPQPAGRSLTNTSTVTASGRHKAEPDEKAKSTTHLTVADRWGNVVSYTFTIEQIGGSGMVVPGRGFLLNNELTDFNFVRGHGELAGRGQAAALEHGADDRVQARAARGRARLAGRRDDHHHASSRSLVNHVDFGQSLPDAVAAPRASQRNSEPTPAEPAFIAPGRRRR